MKKRPRPDHDVHVLCTRAAIALKRAGFVLVNVSMRSEACYYRIPGRHGLLRVASHGMRHPPSGLGDVVATPTFRPNGPAPGSESRGTLRIAEEKIDHMIALAAGQYLLRSAEPRPSRYTGPRPASEERASHG